jgi:hypothetical protein
VVSVVDLKKLKEDYFERFVASVLTSVSTPFFRPNRIAGRPRHFGDVS